MLLHVTHDMRRCKHEQRNPGGSNDINLQTQVKSATNVNVIGRCGNMVDTATGIQPEKRAKMSIGTKEGGA